MQLGVRLGVTCQRSGLLRRCLMTASTMHSKDQLPDMNGGYIPVHVNNVRDKLREIVGASTNWRDHVQAMEERKALQSLLAKKQEDLPPRRMKDSYIEVMLPLGSEPQLREKYLNVYNNVRFGRILEDLDSLGVLICYTHTKSESCNMSPLSIVTALVDKIDLRKQIISPDCDVKLTGHVSWVGKTSMEVKMHMLQLHDGVYSPVLDATFVMVARDPENRRPAFVNPLVPDGPEEESLLKQGEMNKVCYTENNYTQIRVHSEVSDPITREHHTTNIFHFTYKSEKEVPQIVPQTYGESMLYLDGKRHFDAVVQNKNDQSQSS